MYIILQKNRYDWPKTSIKVLHISIKPLWISFAPVFIIAERFASKWIAT